LGPASLGSKPGSLGQAGRPATPVPAQLPALALWFRSDARVYKDTSFTTPVSADGDPGAGWKSAGGPANSVNQTTGAAQPVWHTNVQNGRPALRFNGGSQTFLPLASALAASATYSYFAVLKLTNSPVVIDWLAGPAGAPSWGWDGTNPYVRDNSTFTDEDLVSALDNTHFHTIGVTYDGSAHRFYLDGALDATVPRAWSPSGGVTSLNLAGIACDLAEVTAHGTAFNNATALAYMANYWRPRWATW
jgi:hypothetical protein